MNKKFNLLKSAKYIVLAVFLIISIVSVLLIGTIRINYNISDYLDDSTDTKISLGIMENEFGLISNIQVMVKDVSADEAEEIKATLKGIENVIFVNFNSQNSDYYKDNCALFVVLVNGNEYSDTAKAALADISEAMTDRYGEGLELGGTVMEKKLLREAIQGEIVMILGISIGLVAILMLLTAASWIEPLVLLAASGVAVLLNMGTNAIFGQISYITNAIAAILQLALSIDYSIVLLHSYRAKKATEEDNEKAMLHAIKEVVKPVSASALTTIAGLLGLIFMSFTIGFDIGSVLMKSIVISAITALTLLPALLLIFDKLMQKTAKKSLEIKGKLFTDISIKAGKVILPVALVIIAGCCILNFNNSYNFVDSCNKNENITDKFGESGTLIVLYENAEDGKEKEKILAELLKSYKKDDGSDVIKNIVSYETTIGQYYDVEKASRDLGIDHRDAELLFTIYRFTEDDSIVEMDIETFITFAMDLIENDSQASGFISENTVKMLNLLIDLDVMIHDDYTAAEFCEAIAELEMEGLHALDADSIKQVYGLMFWDQIEKTDVNFGEMLDFLITSGMLNDEYSKQLAQLPEKYELISSLKLDLTHPDEKIGVADIPALIKKYNLNVDSTQSALIWHNVLGKKPSEKMTFEELFETLITNPDYVSRFPEKMVEALEAIGSFDYSYIYYTKEAFDKTFASSYEYDEFIPALSALIKQATGQNLPLGSVDNIDLLMQQLYIMYFNSNGTMPDGKVSCIDFMNYVLEIAKTNAIIAEKVPAEILPRLENLISDADALSIFLNSTETFDYKQIKAHIESFAKSVKSMDVSISVSEDAMMGLYVKYATANSLVETGTLSATELLDFVLEAAETNELIKASIDEDMKATIRESQENMISADKLLYAKGYSRMLLTVNLPAESAESSRFVEYLSAAVKDVFGEGAYVAGEIATTNDLIKAFDDDNKLISIFTVVSIFLIIMFVFKSASLPVILVAIIQGAIWIAMSMSAFTGSMFFMSYLMSMCILMGATIDYGILLSTNYVRNRKEFDKATSLNMALDAAMPTIFTSGLILMICGLVVGLIASQTSISSVGFLLFRGTLISTVMITIVLPALLYLLDSFVVKLTIKKSTKELFEAIKAKFTKA